jgi:hypothetical protein
MDLAMVSSAQWDGELVTHLAAERRVLREAQVMGVRGSAAANQARLLGNEPDVIPVANPARLRQRQHAYRPPWTATSDWAGRIPDCLVRQSSSAILAVL